MNNNTTTTITNNILRKARGWLGSARPVLAMGFLSVLMVSGAGCLDEPSDVPEVSAEVQQASIANMGAQIAAHPAYPIVSQHATQALVDIMEHVAVMPEPQVNQLLQALENCGSPAACENLVNQQFGISSQSMEQAAAAAWGIASDLGLNNLDPQSRKRAFRFAQVLSDGEGVQNAMLDVALPNATFSCTNYNSCDEELGLLLGTSKGDYMNELSLTFASGSGPSSASSNGEGIGTVSYAIEPGTIAALITAGVALVKLIEDIAWNSDEANKECHHDSDCPPDEYCHKLGSNDCRPRRNQGAACTRDSQCASNCCKFYWGWVVCRPSDKCD